LRNILSLSHKGCSHLVHQSASLMCQESLTAAPKIHISFCAAQISSPDPCRICSICSPAAAKKGYNFRDAFLPLWCILVQRQWRRRRIFCAISCEFFSSCARRERLQSFFSTARCSPRALSVMAIETAHPPPHPVRHSVYGISPPSRRCRAESPPLGRCGLKI
jgi:hypothetical protein